MPTNEILKIKTKQNNLYLRVAKGHFASNQSHSNYYIDVAAQKSRLSEAKAVAEKLCSGYKYSSTIVDTILCLDGTEVVGTCLADTLVRNDFRNINAHQTIYVVTPETSGSQLLFRDNIVPMIKGKHVLVLAVSVASGGTVKPQLRRLNITAESRWELLQCSLPRRKLQDLRLTRYLILPTLTDIFQFPLTSVRSVRKAKSLMLLSTVTDFQSSKIKYYKQKRWLERAIFFYYFIIPAAYFLPIIL